MISHNTPSYQANARELCSTSHELQEVHPLRLLEEVYPVRDAADEVVDRFVLFDSVVGVGHISILMGTLADCWRVLYQSDKWLVNIRI